MRFEPKERIRTYKIRLKTLNNWKAKLSTDSKLIGLSICDNMAILLSKKPKKCQKENMCVAGALTTKAIFANLP